jgi:hypothetical protein
MAHLFVDISGHGFGHLAQAAPVLNALCAAQSDLHLTIRSALPRERLAQRIAGDFTHIHSASDFGFVMLNALDIDLAASARRYREFHADWPLRVLRETEFLARLAPDVVLADIAYLPLAGAAALGIPAVALCSLNWADLVDQYFHREDWFASAHKQMLSAYRSANFFLRLTPGMPMPDLPNQVIVGPVAAEPDLDRDEVAHRLGLPIDCRWVLVALGGFDFPLPMEDWPDHEDVLWLRHEDFAGYDLPFNDLLASVDAVITKPGYGTFVEAAVHGVPALYLRRPEWPEEPCLVDWLRLHGRAGEITREQAQRGDLLPTLEALWALPAPPRPMPTGVVQITEALLDFL